MTCATLAEFATILTEKGSTEKMKLTQTIHLLWFGLLLAACGSLAPSSQPTPTTVAPTETTAAPSAEATETPNTYDETTLAQGQINYSVFCVACHGPDAKGVENAGISLVGSSYFTEKSDQEILAFIIEGRPTTHPDNTSGIEMPPRGGYPNLGDGQILSIIAYLRAEIVLE